MLLSAIYTLHIYDSDRLFPESLGTFIIVKTCSIPTQRSQAGHKQVDLFHSVGTWEVFSFLASRLALHGHFPWWAVLSYFLLTLGGLEFATTEVCFLKQPAVNSGWIMMNTSAECFTASWQLVSAYLRSQKMHFFADWSSVILDSVLRGRLVCLLPTEKQAVRSWFGSCA